MGQKSSILAKMAWRAKWRNRIKKWKTALVVIFLAVTLIPGFLAFTPWLPEKVKKQIEDTKFDPITGDLRHGAVVNMYRMGMFYGITMREKEEILCYRRLESWYYGYDLEDSLRGTQAVQYERLEFPEESIKYVGYAVFSHAYYMRIKGHRQMAVALYELYLDHFGYREDGDPDMVIQAEQYSKRALSSEQ